VKHLLPRDLAAACRSAEACLRPRCNWGDFVTFRRSLLILMRMEDSMIAQEKSAAVTRGLCEAFGVTAFEDIQADPRPQFGSRLSHRRATTSIPLADHHAYRRSYAPVSHA
jgi:hypothetical protein